MKSEDRCPATHPVLGVACTWSAATEHPLHRAALTVGKGPAPTWFDDGHVPFNCRCDRTACMFCDGGLFACTRCASFEGATTTECPGESMTKEQQDSVYAGTLDFRDGEWRPVASRHSPAFWNLPEVRALLDEYRQKAATFGARKNGKTALQAELEERLCRVGDPPT